MPSLMKLGEQLDPYRAAFYASQLWPPDTGGRLERYGVYAGIFDGDHVNALGDKMEETKYGLYLTCNIASLIVKASVDLLFGEEIKLDIADVTDEEDSTLLEIWKGQKVQQKCYEAAMDCATLGDSVMHVFRDADGNPVIDTIPAANWFPEFSMDNIREVIRHKLCWPVALQTKYGEKMYLKSRIHEKGLIINELWAIERGRLTKNLLPKSDEWKFLWGDVPKTEDTGVDDFLVVHIPNFRTSREYFGRGEYLGMESIFSALNARLTQWNYVLAYHADPILKGPPGMLDEAGQLDRKSIDFVEVSDKETDTLEYLTYDARLEDSKNLVEELTNKILLITETDKALLGMDAGGGPASGRALKFALLRTLAKVGRKRLYWDAAIKQLLGLSQRLAGEEPDEVSLIWPDGLPQDREEMNQEMTQRIADRTIDHKRAIQRMDNVSQKQAQEILDDIEAEDTTETDAIANAVTNRRQPTFGVDIAAIEKDA